MAQIVDVRAREILDSRGNPTVEVEVEVRGGYVGRYSVPSGASTGSNEALELRDKEDRYLGLGVKKAVRNVLRSIKPKIIGLDSKDQQAIDELLIKLDGTDNKSRLGANAILAVSVATLKAQAASKKKPLYEYIGSGKVMPLAMMNILNGGMHADNSLDFQEFMIIPKHNKFKERVRIGSEVFHSLKSILKEKGFSTGVGDEGGFAPDLENANEALDLIVEAIEKAGYTPGKNVFLALDVAATELYDKESELYTVDGKQYSPLGLIDYYEELVEKYPIISIEDPLAEDDWEHYELMTTRLGGKCQLVGDDLFVTNPKLLKKGIETQSCNAILIKPNQIGTYTEMVQTILMAKQNNYKTIISHRSGETEDTFIAHVAVGLDLGQIKTGSLSRIDRIAKYNELIRIEENL